MENSSLMKKSYSRYALATALFLIVAAAFQFFNALVLAKILPESFANSSSFSFLNILIPEYLIGFPVLVLITLKMDKKTPEKNKFGFGKFVLGFFMCWGVLILGMILGTGITWATTKPFGVNMADTNALGNLMANSKPFLRILTVGICAPVFEELIFRKFLIDRVVKYGEWVAIITSALMFGLFHGNFSQFFYATLLGGIFAYVYIRTGKVWITIIYHMIINLSTSVITVSLLGLVDMDAVNRYAEISQQVLANPNDAALTQQMTEAMMAASGIFLFYGWLMFEGLLGLIGIVIWIIILAKKKIKVQTTENQVEKGMKFAWGNVGMIIFIVATVSLFVFNYLSTILPAIQK